MIMEAPKIYAPKSKTYTVKVNGVLYGTIHQKDDESLDSLEQRAMEKYDVKKVSLEKL
jgi:hypothetical protein